MAESFDISQIAQYADKTKKDLDKVARSVILQISTNIIIRTPVDSGRLINNWYPSFNAPSQQITNALGKKGAAARARVAKTLPVDVAFDGKTFYLSNNLPYAYRIEYEGYSKVKAPAGMVRISVTEANAAFRKAIASLT